MISGPLKEAIILAEEGGDVLAIDGHMFHAGRSSNPSTTMQIVEEAITRHRFLEHNASMVSERAQKLLLHTQRERERLQSHIEKLEADVALGQQEALLAHARADTAEDRARHADRRAQESERRNEDLVAFCAQLIEAVEPMLCGNTAPFANKEELFAFLWSIEPSK